LEGAKMRGVKTSAEDKAAIVMYAERFPQASARQIAELLATSPRTVGRVLREHDAQTQAVCERLREEAAAPFEPLPSRWRRMVRWLMGENL
jgi:hypothetical protein